MGFASCEDKGRFRVAVGQAHSPHRCMINHSDYSQQEWDNGKSMSCQGWRHYLEFVAFTSKKPGTKRIVVGQALGPHRCMFNHRARSQEEWDNGADMNFQGWTHLCSFWAFSSPQPGTIRIVIGEASNPHRAMINHDNLSQSEWNNNENTMNTAGWTHSLEFWAYPAQIGQIGEKEESTQTVNQDFIQVPIVEGRSVTITFNKA